MTKGIAEQIAKWRAYADDLCDAGGEPDDTCGRDKARAEIYRACATTLEKLAADHLEAVQTPHEEKLQQRVQELEAELEKTIIDLGTCQVTLSDTLIGSHIAAEWPAIAGAARALSAKVQELEREVARLSGSAVQTPPTEKASSTTCASLTPKDWQPIASAPKDGTWFLSWEDGANFVIAWQTDTTCKRGTEAWRDGECFKHDPTHWMPLPAPPTLTPATNE